VEGGDDEEGAGLTSAEKGIVVIVSVHHYKGSFSNGVERKPDHHLSRSVFLPSDQLAGVSVGVVHAHLVREGQLPVLFDGLDAKLISSKLISQAAGLGVELLGHIPHTSGELIPFKPFHRSELRTLSRIIFMSCHRGDEGKEEGVHVCVSPTPSRL